MDKKNSLVYSKIKYDYKTLCVLLKRERHQSVRIIGLLGDIFLTFIVFESWIVQSYIIHGNMLLQP